MGKRQSLQKKDIQMDYKYMKSAQNYLEFKEMRMKIMRAFCNYQSSKD